MECLAPRKFALLCESDATNVCELSRLGVVFPKDADLDAMRVMLVIVVIRLDGMCSESAIGSNSKHNPGASIREQLLCIALLLRLSLNDIVKAGPRIEQCRARVSVAAVFQLHSEIRTDS